MKIKNKGKVHPSPSSSSSSSSDGVVLSVLQLLPAAILALASVLSLDDREVLAYMITRSMKTSPASFSNSQDSSKKRASKKLSNSKTETNKGNYNNHHQFDCECFDCYRSYWFRWDSSPNRELIHQAIEAFEDHLAHGEKPNKKTAGRGKQRREKIGRREAQKPADSSSKDEVFVAAVEEEVGNAAVSSVPEVVLPPLCEVVAVEKAEEVEEEVGELKVEATAEEVVLIVRAAAVSDHKGLVRKVLPDVLGLFNSRLWSLWSPNA